jgi:hypothetical protein
MLRFIRITMFKKVLYFFPKVITAIILMLLLLLPVVNFKINIASEIFPSLEIILVYYFGTNYQVKSWQIFIAGFFFDQIYSMPIGTNSLVFILGDLWLKYISKWFILKIYVINLINFCGYCLIIFVLRYFIITGCRAHTTQLLILFFQYMTTIFSYSLVRILLDKLLKYCAHHAK